MIRGLLRETLAAFPVLDSAFRRHVWSRIHFPEAELRALNALAAGALDCAIDVGAALGGYAWVLSRKARRVICYEPGDAHAAYLAKAVRGTNILLVAAAVGAETGERDLFTPGHDNEARHMATLSRANPIAGAKGTRVQRVPVVALDTDLPNRLGSAARIDLLKVDVEGFENAVLEGARQTLVRDHPLVIAEIEVRHNPEWKKAFEILEVIGYSAFFWRDGRYHPLPPGSDIADLQLADDLAVRLRRGHDPATNRYINNFVFQHHGTRVKLA